MAQLTFEELLSQLKQKDYQPIYFFQGEEHYFIDELVSEIESNALSEAEQSFNQTILYGKDIGSEVGKIIDIAMRLPMMAERQVVIVKEAQHVKSWDLLIPYLEQPTASTVLVFAHKNKKIDGRSAFAKQLKKRTVFFQSDPIKEYQIDRVIETIAQENGLNISPKSIKLLIEFLGTNLSKIAKEISKLKLADSSGKITPEVIEENIGISKDYNVFELQKAILKRQEEKVFRILNYFKQNPKAGNIVFIITIFYSLFSKLYTMHVLGPISDRELAKQIGVNPYYISDYTSARAFYSLQDIQRIIQLLAKYDLKSKGLGSTNTPDHELLRELCFQIIHQHEL